MLDKIIQFSIANKLIVMLFTATIVGFGLYSLTQIPIGAVPDITNNQVQVITTSRNLSTLDVEQFITYPVELEMANLPGVTEIRSVSKFGLSVVTIVFNDAIGTYLPRQLIAEKLKAAAENIPAGMGTPQMGPITTGLGEIYQYVLDTKPGYDTLYSTMDLRTIQDWIVKRQLSGISGVVEINTWGGFLKQYEVAVNPTKLQSMGISIGEIFQALENNNSVAGGGYIEKTNESYFIRGEGLVGSKDDIENIVVKNTDGLPIYIRDVATVQDGYATRFGAITGNGEGEKVLGQVMMLKDANSNKVIEDVKERVAEIQKTLPEGVYINPFLERSELIAKTTNTVAENLILGCLIVIFVVVLLLGNMRSGLVIASVIPLSLLFALGMMYVFGVDANLMSLGAIDFGIIIDGAVIIVEYIAYKITAQKERIDLATKEERVGIIDSITMESSSKMMTSAVFGQLIILIVFIPILSLTGVEGKMFRPMAMTFSFALAGAMILCFTYVPVAASLFLKPSKQSKRNISLRLMNFISSMYTPSIELAMKFKKVVLASSLALLLFTVYLYSTMGGEFVPTLDEGDFVIQPVLRTGTSLSNTIAITTRIEKILLDQFPEVDQVVSRIGAAEVPTDPMSMEESDVIIKLKPKSEWVSAKSKDELAEKFKEALSIIPGLDFEFTQPIEMRFNELITGVRADVAIKIFGEDLDVLYNKGLEIKQLVENVPGASDVILEKITGLPQMTVKFNRQKIAKYGLNIKDLNDMITMGFAGATAGNVFEGEKRFDLVVRFDKNHRKNIKDIETLYVDLPRGGKVPLSELAEISYTKGPAKISRDDTKRRIVVGINVRNRDLQSVVEDIKHIINTKVKLPVGYTIDYGGQFENLQSASRRLKFAVPIALILIFIMLHFAFKSFREALMVFTAIPLSAVGGVLLLWIRGLPFSISAGVGFIALFGIAVLNGIVLIEHFKDLKKKGITNIDERVILGTKQRLRPVLLTAGAAAMGFLPMAVSTSAGAEVQRPLATVVIGGLISATFLTMIVLPVLYSLVDEWKFSFLRTAKSRMTLFLILSLFAVPAMAQEKNLTLEQAINLALNNNLEYKASKLQVEQSDRLIGTAYSIEKTGVFYGYDQSNFGENNLPLSVFGIQQNLEFPTVYNRQRHINSIDYQLSITQSEMMALAISKEVALQYNLVVYYQNKMVLYQYLDSLFQDFSNAANRKYELGETNYLEMLTAQSKKNYWLMQLNQLAQELKSTMAGLKAVVQTDSSFVIQDQVLKVQLLENEDTAVNPGISYMQQQVNLVEARFKLEKSKLLPGLQLEYFLSTNDGPDSKKYNAYQVGIQIPLFFKPQQNKIVAARIQREMTEYHASNYSIRLQSIENQLKALLQKYSQAIYYYQSTGKNLAEEINRTAQKSYHNGEIDFFQYIQSLENATSIVIEYLDNLVQYNATLFEIKYLTL
ncbi:MAG: CusA/CzcA family heavy metal efflux RND transporter [Bacteroidales bacterium]|nr:CusA/CzcA family heavy metal efflux RND transporter [Bacteroidales bacterium]